jgi:hypothetical protein
VRMQGRYRMRTANTRKRRRYHSNQPQIPGQDRQAGAAHLVRSRFAPYVSGATLFNGAFRRSRLISLVHGIDRCMAQPLPRGTSTDGLRSTGSDQHTTKAEEPHRGICRARAMALRHAKRRPPDAARNAPSTANAALSGRGPTEHQQTPWPVPAVRLNA